VVLRDVAAGECLFWIDRAMWCAVRQLYLPQCKEGKKMNGWGYCLILVEILQFRKSKLILCVNRSKMAKKH
jgi:hypothetical protein